MVQDGGSHGINLEYLERRGAPRDVIEAIDALSRRPGEPDEAYWARVGANPVARAVKFADIDDNTDPERLARLGAQDRDCLTAKYARARAVLGAAAPDSTEA